MERNLLDLIQAHGLDALQAAVDADLARRSGRKDFASFVKQAWRYVSADPLVWNWHLDVMCSHLEAVFRGEIRRLAINIGPGYAKSIIVSVLFPAWCWVHRASTEFICASYADSLATRDSIKCRSVIESEWYRETYAKVAGWRLRHDQNAKDLFYNTAFGKRMAVGISGGTGERADIIIVDDPLNAAEAHSRAKREEGVRFLRDIAPGRFKNNESGAIVMIMQRLHEEDATGYALKTGGWEHLMLPSEFDPKRRSVTHRLVEKKNGVTKLVKEEFWRDPRTEAGELLFPQRFSKAALALAKLEMREMGYAGQHLQNPAPAEGSLFKVTAWRFWKRDGAASRAASRPAEWDKGEALALSADAIEQMEQIIAVDATFKKTADGSFVAIHCWAKRGPDRFLLDRVHARMDFVDTCEALIRFCNKHPAARRKIIEDKANGPAIVSQLKRKIAGLDEVSPGSDSKEARAAAVQPYQASGNVFLPDDAPWLEEYIAEHAMFPKGANDDDVDCQAMALLDLERDKTTMDLWGEANA